MCTKCFLQITIIEICMRWPASSVADADAGERWTGKVRRESEGERDEKRKGKHYDAGRCVTFAFAH
uniref:Uncharacterized protein n=1 Tax=Oryza sativa subsp. japonica TaxID=39947 RepID=Q6Z3D5_ORYSJ|nr:hypothetical protein [Oryza sativa Japonica Group]